MLKQILLQEPAGDSPQCLIFTESTGPRLIYTLDFIFHQVLCCRYRVILSEAEFLQATGVRINYSPKTFPRCLNILPEGLLTETGLRSEKPKLEDYEGLPRCFFSPLQNESGRLPFDLFAFVFYFISRYEEWQDPEKDEHGRFGIASSLLFRAGVHTRPLVDLYIQEFRGIIEASFGGIHFTKRRPQIISTIDIDNLYAYKGRPLWRTLGSTMKDLLKFDLVNIRNRISVLSGNQKDPFDIYSDVPAFCKQEAIPLVLFFLYRNGTAYDRGLEPGGDSFLQVFSELKRKAVTIGIHPSYYSQEVGGSLEEEVLHLEKNVEAKVDFSRHHFLRFDVRSSASRLLRSGIRSDFSCGFSDQPGFRAGTSFPFYHFDFSGDAKMELLRVPFCLMDGAYSIHRKSGHQTMLIEALKMAEDIRLTGGNFVSVYHERSFYDHLYPGFGSLYKQMHLQIKALFGK